MANPRAPHPDMPFVSFGIHQKWLPCETILVEKVGIFIMSMELLKRVDSNGLLCGDLTWSTWPTDPLDPHSTTILIQNWYHTTITHHEPSEKSTFPPFSALVRDPCSHSLFRCFASMSPSWPRPGADAPLEVLEQVQRHTAQRCNGTSRWDAVDAAILRVLCTCGVADLWLWNRSPQ